MLDARLLRRPGMSEFVARLVADRAETARYDFESRAGTRNPAEVPKDNG